MHGWVGALCKVCSTFMYVVSVSMFKTLRINQRVTTYTSMQGVAALDIRQMNVRCTSGVRQVYVRCTPDVRQRHARETPGVQRMYGDIECVSTVRLDSLISCPIR